MYPSLGTPELDENPCEFSQPQFFRLVFAVTFGPVAKTLARRLRDCFKCASCFDFSLAADGDEWLKRLLICLVGALKMFYFHTVCTFWSASFLIFVCAEGKLPVVTSRLAKPILTNVPFLCKVVFGCISYSRFRFDSTVKKYISQYN